ncbi:Uncharacterised protein (plasmid) [Tsukamurella tyrosinosolvens]|uniref:Uncharacterized protein n=1 Tax=Tsukamurella tyrosinosolvens TaxID=57704 RepID=A0A1H4UA23_TSUTY|nr:hypothetical protein [Tsukamurella tyrosinosolvens]KXO92985.1 hypothetical protein AXK58_14035 [Tsukamurella tyrosinosolvens]SEC65599.1 hypothetical protein SAMN04489793_2830 [Tsukamurella tyrosinosolvens]VEH94085.1 Uncharacterised protein [Tsukamurella tyrosinosolvens]
MSFRYNIEVRVDTTVHQVGGFDSARAAAAASHVEASFFGQPTGINLSVAQIQWAIEAGASEIPVRDADPEITVLVS